MDKPVSGVVPSAEEARVEGEATSDLSDAASIVGIIGVASLPSILRPATVAMLVALVLHRRRRAGRLVVAVLLVAAMTGTVVIRQRDIDAAKAESSARTRRDLQESAERQAMIDTVNAGFRALTSSSTIAAEEARIEALRSSIAAYVNGYRAEQGIGSLEQSPELTAYAQNWAEHMQLTGKLSHSDGLPSQLDDFLKLGENVGVGGSWTAVAASFERSASHERNMTDPAFDHIGVGVSPSEGRVFVALDFGAVARPPGS